MTNEELATLGMDMSRRVMAGERLAVVAKSRGMSPPEAYAAIRGMQRRVGEKIPWYPQDDAFLKHMRTKHYTQKEIEIVLGFPPNEQSRRAIKLMLPIIKSGRRRNGR